jgi:hypothetical protein
MCVSLKSAIPSQSDEEESQFPSESDHVTPANDRSKRGAERVPFSSVGSNSVPSPDTIREAGTGSASERSVCVPCNADPPLQWPLISSVNSCVLNMSKFYQILSKLLYVLNSSRLAQFFSNFI